MGTICLLRVIVSFGCHAREKMKRKKGQSDFALAVLAWDKLYKGRVVQGFAFVPLDPLWKRRSSLVRCWSLCNPQCLLIDGCYSCAFCFAFSFSVFFCWMTFSWQTFQVTSWWTWRLCHHCAVAFLFPFFFSSCFLFIFSCNLHFQNKLWVLLGDILFHIWWKVSVEKQHKVRAWFTHDQIENDR